MFDGYGERAVAGDRGSTRVKIISPTQRVVTFSLDKESALSLAGSRTPFIVFPFTANGTVSFTVDRTNPETVALVNFAVDFDDNAKGAGVTVSARLPDFTGTGGVMLKRAGTARGKVLYSLIVQPYETHPSARQITYFRNVSVTLTSAAPFPSMFREIPPRADRSGAGRKESRLVSATGFRVRIVVNRDGIYRISGRQLDTTGVDLSGYSLRNMSLWNRGKQIPIYVGNASGNVFTRESYFEFYGTANRAGYSQNRPDLYIDPYTDENVYYLTSDPASPVQRLVTESGAVGRNKGAVDLSEYSFTRTVHLEENLKFERLNLTSTDENSDGQDHWFWTEASGGQAVSVQFQLSKPDTTSLHPLSLTAAFQGITGSGGTTDAADQHRAELFLNGNHVLTAGWNGQSINISRTGVQQGIPQSVLHNGRNTIEVHNSTIGDPSDSKLALNWLELNYQSLYRAENDYLEFSMPDNVPPGVFRFLVRNFNSPSISVYRVNSSRISDVKIVVPPAGDSEATYAADFELYVRSTGEKFIAVSDAGKLSPLRIERVRNASLTARDYSADYIMITNRALADVSGDQPDAGSPLTRLSEWYDSHGIKTLVVNAVQIYDDFNFGVESPYAIKRFIAHAYRNWSITPKYVLLAGAGTWNPRDRGESLIPAMMIQTYRFGATACDNFFACVDGDDPVPDIAIGRIPAANRSELGAVVDKILSYYSGKSSGWQNTVMLVAGEENEFHVQADSIARSIIPSRHFIRRLYTSVKDPIVDPQYYGLSGDLVGAVNRGVALLNYMGHGGGAVWADNGLLTNEEVSGFSNTDAYPFVTSMTCFTGAFDRQMGKPLATTLLLAAGKGAVGVLGSAGFGWLRNDYYLATEIFKVLFDRANAKEGVGMNIAAAKADYYAAYAPFWPQAASMLNQYNLIGDPALFLRLPDDNLEVHLDSYAPAPGDDISGSVTGGEVNGDLTLELTNEGGDPSLRTETKLDKNGSAEFRFQRVASMSPAAQVRAYAYGGSTGSSAAAGFSNSGSIVRLKSIGVAGHAESMSIRIRALAASSAAEVGTVWFHGGVREGNERRSSYVVKLDIPLAPDAAAGEYSSDFNMSRESVKPGYVISGRILAAFSDGSVDSTPPLNYAVPGAADISAFPKGANGQSNTSIAVVADSVIRLQGLVYNWTGNPASNVRVDFSNGIHPDGSRLGSTRVDLDSASLVMASIPVALPAGRYPISMTVVFDSLSAGYDLNDANNITSKTIDVNFATADSSGNVALDSNAVLSGARPGSIFKVGRLALPLHHQPFLTAPRDTDRRVILYEFSSLKNEDEREYGITLPVDRSDSAIAANASALRIFGYDSRSRTLNLVGGTSDGESVSAVIRRPGIFTTAFSSDRTPPHISMSVGDQFFTNGDFVPPDPHFSITVHDEDAVDLRPGSLDVSLDDAPVDSSLIVLPDTVTDPSSVTASVMLPAGDGRHTVSVTAKDASGNTTDPVTADFVVRSDFTLRLFGCYPNPFIDRTFIAFEITSGNTVESVEIKIYTVSGRLVKTIRFPSNNPSESIGLLQGGTGSPTSVGYHEAWWDGTDNFGNQVANGVYFYKVAVKSGGKTVAETGKMARLR